ncbi:hypothetical protein [Paracoccus marinaquae]|uniref:DUF2628 domain-containing protein n=1 Tax=Paracoccus marinaquae TaxID=2841926 RepID=A0ABS6AEA3_9RHOB|nr:hypothetical protein [Paracoccus marinaquae]MBU3028848.1 hypothetical protein [Paracoccus marinaquae]
MAYATVNFHHRQSGRIKNAPVGFSWTTFFFGLFPALLRGHWVGAIVIGLLSFATFGFAGPVIAFFYNKWYINHLIGEGFKVSSASQDISYLSQRLKVALPLDEDQPQSLVA